MLQIIRGIQHTELANQLTGLGLSRLCLGEFGFERDQRAQGGGNAGLESRRAPARTRHARLERLLCRALGLPVLLCGRDAGLGPAHRAGQRQG
ncbi:MAG: hypothetical protein R6X13_07135, partial [bacterium]